MDVKTALIKWNIFLCELARISSTKGAVYTHESTISTNDTEMSLEWKDLGKVLNTGCPDIVKAVGIMKRKAPQKTEMMRLGIQFSV